MNREHHYQLALEWTGNEGAGTGSYTSYNRSHEVLADGKPAIYMSSDPAFRGDSGRYNPEELLVASLSSCHMLWYLHLCSANGVVVTSYIETATGTMVEAANGGGHFKEVCLNPVVTVRDPDMVEKAQALHAEANRLCFIANSCNFPVYHKPACLVQS